MFRLFLIHRKNLLNIRLLSLAYKLLFHVCNLISQSLCLVLFLLKLYLYIVQLIGKSLDATLALGTFALFSLSKLAHRKMFGIVLVLNHLVTPRVERALELLLVEIVHD